MITLVVYKTIVVSPTNADSAPWRHHSNNTDLLPGRFRGAKRRLPYIQSVCWLNLSVPKRAQHCSCYSVDALRREVEYGEAHTRFFVQNREQSAATNVLTLAEPIEIN